MNLSDLRTEVQARGFDYVSSTRINRWINLPYLRILDREAWPFLETELTGQTAPVTISDLRAVLFVANTTNDYALEWEDLRTIREADPDLDDTGHPEYWYLNNATTLSVWPANTTDSLTIRYLTNGGSGLVADGDSPLLPGRYHYMLVDAACVRAYRDSDNMEMAMALDQEVERAILEMRDAVLVPNYSNAASIAPPGYAASTDW